MIIEKKVNKEFFELIIQGVKTHELRLNDFECNPGDTLVLREVDPKTGKLTGRGIEKEISHVQHIRLDQWHWPIDEIIEKGLKVM